MALVELERKDDVALLRLNRGVTNPIDMELLDVLGERLAGLEQDGTVRGLVLTGSEKFFAIGFDIPTLFDLEKEEMRRFYTRFNEVCHQLMSFPRPTVAAVGGHATAGGCILALCCDERFVAEGKKLMGLNEVKLGVPVPYLSYILLRDLVGTRQARRLVDSGDFLGPEGLREIGMVDEVHPQELLVEKAVERARALGASPPDGFAAIKRNRLAHVEKLYQGRKAQDEEEFIDLWYSEEARRQLDEARKRF